MKKMSKSNFDLWRSIGTLNHAIGLLRQQELGQHHILLRQQQVLGTIKDLGSKATLSEIAKLLERERHVISKQTKMMERDGLIKRTKETPRSNLLRLDLTKKGLNMIQVGRHSEAIESIFSSLSEDERQQMETLLNKLIIQTQKYKSAKNQDHMGFLE